MKVLSQVESSYISAGSYDTAVSIVCAAFCYSTVLGSIFAVIWDIAQTRTFSGENQPLLPF